MLAETTTTLQLETVLFWFTIVAVAVSAISGILIAGKNHLDLFGMIVIALATALGGSLRDMLLNKNVFWIEGQLFLIVALCAGVATFFMRDVIDIRSNCF